MESRLAFRSARAKFRLAAPPKATSRDGTQSKRFRISASLRWRVVRLLLLARLCRILRLDSFLKQAEQRPIKLMAVPILELGARTLGIEDAERSPKVPQRPARVQVVK